MGNATEKFGRVDEISGRTLSYSQDCPNSLCQSCHPPSGRANGHTLGLLVLCIPFSTLFYYPRRVTVKQCPKICMVTVLTGFHFFQLHVNKTPLNQKQKRGSIGSFNHGGSKMIPYVRTDLKPYPIPRQPEKKDVFPVAMSEENRLFSQANSTAYRVTYA